MKFLVDEHAEYYQAELEKRGHETESAKKFRKLQKKLNLQNRVKSDP